MKNCARTWTRTAAVQGRIAKRRHLVALSSAEPLVFLGFNITMRYISLHFTWRILEHERSRLAVAFVV